MASEPGKTSSVSVKGIRITLDDNNNTRLHEDTTLGKVFSCPQDCQQLNVITVTPEMLTITMSAE